VSLLALDGVTKTFSGARALDGVSLTVERGEIHALVGENGAGKSTLIKVISGAHTPDAGRVTLDGVPLPVGDPLAVARRGVAIIYQELTLVPELTVAENIFLGRERGTLWLRRREMKAEAQRVLSDAGVDVSARARVGSLSIPKRQMVEIARAISAASSVLVLDEPTSSLPDRDVRVLLDVLRGLRSRGLGLVYVSHRLDEVFAIADRVTVLRDGKVTSTGLVRGLDRSQLIRSMVGRDLGDEYPPRTTPLGDVALEVSGLHVPGRVENVDLTVRRGEIVGLAGLVGAGRTSVGLALGGALASRGTIRVGGAAVKFRSPSAALAAGVAYVTEDRKLSGMFASLDVGTNITITSLSKFVRFGWLRRGGEREAARQAATTFDVRCTGLHQPAGTLSGGNQQKLLLARFLLEPRRVLILDEPTRGVDVGARAGIYATIRRLAESGLAIVMISSELPELLGMADRVIVLRERRTVGELPRADATEERILSLATPGAAA
jgi:ribose transport system ATP-binding protein